ncbi:HEAT repeat domain-containing protein [Inquilinus sp. Marseille-Q2685]|uniref:HEAT repeat domain-containing protein n=1 Tax=Inquilinus sp. Marseille-Q2685 TaxID=2866581 RepID=UPI001CE3F8AF|nr:HEAT repeat domain-containing protein [Inquilinus sp. Marseille-Q2685]
MLLAIWYFSLALALAALLVMAVLILRRALLQARARRSWAAVGELQGKIFAFLGNEIDECAMRRALAEADRRSVVDLLVRIDRVIRGDGLRRLIDLARSLDLDTVLRRRLARPAGADSVAAIHSLRLFPGAETERTLRQVVESGPGAAMRLAAAEVLVDLDAPLDADRLVSSLAEAGGLESRTSARVFRRLVSQHPELFLRLAGSAPDTRRRVLALDALGEAGMLAALPVVLAAAGDPIVDVRAQAFRTLARLAHPAAAAAVRRGLADAAWEVRTQAARCAAAIGLTELTGDLEARLDDEVWWVRMRTAEALTRLGEEGLAILRRRAEEPGTAGRIAQAILMQGAG